MNDDNVYGGCWSSKKYNYDNKGSVSSVDTKVGYTQVEKLDTKKVKEEKKEDKKKW